MARFKPLGGITCELFPPSRGPTEPQCKGPKGIHPSLPRLGLEESGKSARNTDSLHSMYDEVCTIVAGRRGRTQCRGFHILKDETRGRSLTTLRRIMSVARPL